MFNHSLTNESIYLRSSHLNMYTFFPKIIFPHTITSHLQTFRCKVQSYCRAPKLLKQPMTNTFVSSLTGISENKIPFSLCYVVFDRRMISTRSATLGGSGSKVALHHSSNNHNVASPSRNSQIIYPTFVYVCVCVCVCVFVCCSSA